MRKKVYGCWRAVLGASVILLLILSSSGCGLVRVNQGTGQKDGNRIGWKDRLLPARFMGGSAEGEARRSSLPASIGSANRLRPADPLVIHLRGIPREQTIETVVDDRGLIQLPLIGSIRAAGRTASELERAIQHEYIDGRFYRDPTINVLQPSLFYFIQGEIRQPGRFPLVSGVTILQAVAAAGGYTEFANPRRIIISRGDETITVNLREIERNPEKDFEIESGDVVRVPRSLF